MRPELLIHAKCRELAELVDSIRKYAERCPRRSWRGPFCRALQVFEALWRFKGKEVPLDSLGLTERHTPYLLELQRKFGRSAPFENAAVYYIAVLDKMRRRQVAMDLARLLGAK